MSDDKMRYEFEAWALARFINSDTTRPLERYPEDPDQYRYSMVNMAWVSWQASREALVIELPDHLKYADHGEAFYVVKDCAEAIEAPGLKVNS
ncbi:hypothetical protein [Pseudomonas sp. RIT357]|uniref:hypothetical protein n=1 Tax=Pseudomonas sp. RIT357 TaxID=1470593 RepID=UPI0004507E01|nr:hypothetical protein [Pseudomonas sp. RIT357]EZP62683.1 hypothetical protein BW43_05138 [Pseudomonas sp. RIT357]